MIVYNKNKNHYKADFPAYVVNNRNNVSDWILSDGEPEINLIKWCEQFLNKDKIFIDIGAHMGTYTINLAPFCNKVYSFEPQKMTYYQLCGGIALNELYNVTAHNFALGTTEESGTITSLNIQSIDGGGSTIDHNIIESQNGVLIGSENILLKCLDDFDFDLPIGLIKIDVEGYELNVIKGAIKTLTKHNNPPILFEAWDTEWYKEKREELFNYIKSINYEIISIMGYSHMFLANTKN